MTLFLLGAASCFLYFVIAGVVSMLLCESRIVDDREWLFVTVAWPLGLPYLTVRKVLR